LETLLLSISKTIVPRWDDLLEYPIGTTRAVWWPANSGALFLRREAVLPRRSVELEPNFAFAADRARYAAPVKDEVQGRLKRRRSRWTPPGYLRVSDIVDAPLSRASLYREISSGNLSAVRSRAGILVREDDYARWLADATALHTTDVANAAEEPADE
jgi:hypothetical protein